MLACMSVINTSGAYATAMARLLVAGLLTRVPCLCPPAPQSARVARTIRTRQWAAPPQAHASATLATSAVTATPARHARPENSRCFQALVCPPLCVYRAIRSLYVHSCLNIPRLLLICCLLLLTWVPCLCPQAPHSVYSEYVMMIIPKMPTHYRILCVCVLVVLIRNILSRSFF